MKKSQFSIALSIILLFTTFFVLRADVFPVEVLRYSGPPGEYFNLVILGDGYTMEQQGKFIEDAQKVARGLFLVQPFAAMKDSVNVFAVKVTSNQSGAAVNPQNMIDNYFGSSFWSYGIERLLYSWYQHKIADVLAVNTPFYDVGAVMVNDPTYGGSGGNFAIFSTHEQSIEIFLHELGHTFGGLADEYWAGPSYAAELPNMTRNNDPLTIRWKEFLYQNGVGIFPYEGGAGWFRPHENCKMRFLGNPFCDVCKHQLALDIRALARPYAPAAPIAFFSAAEIFLNQGRTIKFNDLSQNRPDSYSWAFEGGTPAYSNEPNPSVTYKESGRFSVSLTVSNSLGEHTLARSGYIQVVGKVNVPQIGAAGDIKLWPSPASDYISIDYGVEGTPARYRILDTLGRLAGEGEHSGNIDVSGLIPGLYVLQLDTPRGIIFARFLKQ